MKNERRTIMSQDRLAALSFPCIESDLLRSISFEELLDDFSAEKSGKRMFKMKGFFVIRILLINFVLFKY